MARSPQATAKQFVREATIGLVVVAVLLALLLHAVVRRFGLWQNESQPRDVVAARVFSRLPKPGEATEPAPRDPVRVPAPIAGSPRSTPAATLASAEPSEVRVAAQPSDNPRSVPSSTGLGSRESGSAEPRSLSTPAPPPSISTPPASLPTGSSGGSFPAAGAGQGSGVSSNEPGNLRDSTTEGETDDPQSESSTGNPGSPFRSVAFESENDRDRVRQVAGTFPVRGASNQSDPRWVVKLEDSSFTYCERNYGDPQWFRALEAWLRKEGTSFEQLPRGIPLTPPSLVALSQTAPELVPRSYRDSGETAEPLMPGTYITSGSENWFDIAARVYGQAGRYVELLELNRGTSVAERDPLEPLPAGTRIQIPVQR